MHASFTFNVKQQNLALGNHPRFSNMQMEGYLGTQTSHLPLDDFEAAFFIALGAGCAQTTWRFGTAHSRRPRSPRWPQETTSHGDWEVSTSRFWLSGDRRFSRCRCCSVCVQLAARYAVRCAVSPRLVPAWLIRAFFANSQNDPHFTGFLGQHYVRFSVLHCVDDSPLKRQCVLACCLLAQDISGEEHVPYLWFACSELFNMLHPADLPRDARLQVQRH